MTRRGVYRWANQSGATGAVAMFIIEALVIAGLAGLALIVSSVVLVAV